MVQVVSTAYASATTLTMPAHQAGDRIFAAAGRNGDISPTLPGTWTQLFTGTMAKVAWKTAASSAETMGTWSNADAVAVIVLRLDPGESWNGTPSITDAAAQSTTITYPELVTAVTSYLLRIGIHRTASNLLTNVPAGWTARTSSAAGILIMDPGGVTAISAGSVGGNSQSVNSNNWWRSFTVRNLVDLPAPQGTAGGTFGWAGDATGYEQPKGSASGAYIFAGGVTVGKRPPKGSASGAYNFAGSATGREQPKGSATLGFTWGGSASGKETPKGSAGTRAYTWSGSATGREIAKGSAGGGFNFAGGPVTGKRSPKGSGNTWGYGWSGGAFGQMPVPRGGVVNAPYSFALTAIGKRAPKGSATLNYTWSATASGKRTAKGNAGTRAYNWSGSAGGTGVPKGSAGGGYQFQGAATGKKIMRGQAVAGFIDYSTDRWLTSSPPLISTSANQTIETVEIDSQPALKLTGNNPATYPAINLKRLGTSSTVVPVGAQVIVRGEVRHPASNTPEERAFFQMNVISVTDPTTYPNKYIGSGLFAPPDDTWVQRTATYVMEAGYTNVAAALYQQVGNTAGNVVYLRNAEFLVENIGVGTFGWSGAAVGKSTPKGSAFLAYEFGAPTTADLSGDSSIETASRWTGAMSGGARVTDRAHSGAASLRLSPGANTYTYLTRTAAGTQQEIPMVFGDRFLIDAWVYVDPNEVVAANLSFVLQTNDINGVRQDQALSTVAMSVIKAAPGWYRYTTVTTLAIAAAVKGWPYFSRGVNNAGTLWFDDIRVAKSLPTAFGATTPKGVAGGGYGWSGSATGQEKPIGSAGTRGYSWQGSVFGRRPAKGGTADIPYRFASTGATGKRVAKGSTTFGYRWTGTAVGRETPKGVATLPYRWSGTSVGKRRPQGYVSDAPYGWDLDVFGQQILPKMPAFADPRPAPLKLISDRQHVVVHTADGTQISQFTSERQLSMKWGRALRETTTLDLTVPPGAGYTKIADIDPWNHWASVWDDTGRDLYWTGPVQKVRQTSRSLQLRAADVSVYFRRTRCPVTNQWNARNPATIANELWLDMIDARGFSIKPLVLRDPRGSTFDFECVRDQEMLDQTMRKLSDLGLYWSVVAGKPVLGPAPLEPIVSLGEEHFASDEIAVERDGTMTFNDVILRAADTVSRARRPLGNLQLETIISMDDVRGVGNADRAAQELVRYTGGIRDSISMPNGAVLSPKAPLTIKDLVPSIRMTVTAYELRRLVELEAVNVNIQPGQLPQVAVDLQSVDDSPPELLASVAQ